MNALTLTQPWATLVAIGAKRVETRSWNCSYLMKPLAIHSAKSFPSWAKQLIFTQPFLETLRTIPEYRNLAADQIIKSLPLGFVLCTCRVWGTRATDIVESALKTAPGGTWYQDVFTSQELAFGDYAPGRWAWILEHIEKLPEPIAANGALGLWEWDAPVSVTRSANAQDAGTGDR